MPDPTPSTSVVIHRHGLLTSISLGFNALFLLFILIAIVSNHRHEPPDRDGHGGGPMECRGFDPRGHFGHHDFDGRHQEWGHHDFADRGEDHLGGGPGEDGPPPHEFGMDPPHGWGGGPGGPGGFGGGMDHFKDMTPPSAGEMTDRFMLALDEKLTLTDAENAQIRPIVQDGIAQFQKDLEAQKAAHQKMLDDAKTKIRAVLTPDQQKKFDDMAPGLGAPPPAPGK
jgi:hypothetical protein